MKVQLQKKIGYPFAWLDEVTELTLNPKKGSADQLQTDELNSLQSRFQAEVRQVIASLKAQTFWIFSEKKKKAVLAQYAQAIQLLKHQAAANQESYPENSPLKAAGSAILDYLDELSHAIEKRYMSYLPEMTGAGEMPASSPDIFKLVCELSVDQMGIILKAADDVKLVVSRSLSTVFKSIVPYLATANKKELSWDSMRSNSYHPEDRDKEIAIAALEKLIRKIREYK
jgi:hypothetical protein